MQLNNIHLTREIFNFLQNKKCDIVSYKKKSQIRIFLNDVDETSLINTFKQISKNHANLHITNNRVSPYSESPHPELNDHFNSLASLLIAIYSSPPHGESYLDLDLGSLKSIILRACMWSSTPLDENQTIGSGDYRLVYDRSRRAILEKNVIIGETRRVFYITESLLESIE